MIDARSRTAVGVAREPLLDRNAISEDDEAKLAAAMRGAEDADPLDGSADRGAHLRVVGGMLAPQERVAAEILESIETRLPNRIRNLDIDVEQDQFVLSGTSNSYYVKQLAQHIAMNLISAASFGRLVNEIEVRSMR